MDITKARIGQRVRGCGMEGKIIKLNTGNPSGFITIIDDFNEVGFDHAALFEPIAPDACESCQKLQGKLNRAAKKIKEQKEDIRIITIGRDAWKAEACQDNRRATYWREELTKLQKEVLEDTAPISEVAKIYIQISPAVLAKIMAEREE